MRSDPGAGGSCRSLAVHTGSSVRDLEMRGMLDERLLVVCTEFGRTLWVNCTPDTGRNDFDNAFTCRLAGAGVRDGFAHCETNHHGANLVSRGLHVHDYHATVRHLMGIDHQRVDYRYAGRVLRLTNVYGNGIRDILI